MDKVSAAGQPGDQVKLRLPDGLRGKIKAAAEANYRSMNAEIVSTLMRVYAADAPKKGGK